MLVLGGSNAPRTMKRVCCFSVRPQHHKNKNYEEALNLYALVKNQHPYSAFATKAKLGIADVQYARQAWPEAEALYKLFKEFHPQHPELDRVIFRIGASVFQQLPPTIDRDLSLAPEAVKYFQLVVSKYPSSSQAAEARKKLEQVQGLLRQKEEYIAQFYFRRGEYLSAFHRYDSLLKAKFTSSIPVRTLYEATVSAHRAKKPAQAQRYFQVLAQKFPNSSEKTKAEEVLSEVRQ